MSEIADPLLLPGERCYEELLGLQSALNDLVFRAEVANGILTKLSERRHALASPVRRHEFINPGVKNEFLFVALEGGRELTIRKRFSFTHPVAWQISRCLKLGNRSEEVIVVDRMIGDEITPGIKADIDVGRYEYPRRYRSDGRYVNVTGRNTDYDHADKYVGHLFADISEALQTFKPRPSEPAAWLLPHVDN